MPLLCCNQFYPEFSFTGSTVCYPEIGCFSNEKPFYDPPLRPISWLPESREEVGTQFLLKTRLNPTVPDILTTHDITSVIASNFEPTRKTIIVCHGYTESGDVEWMQDMATALLSNDDHNVILIDWHPGATALYGKATANTRIVGAEAALLINNIMVNRLSFTYLYFPCVGIDNGRLNTAYSEYVLLPLYYTLQQQLGVCVWWSSISISLYEYR